jgi:hypothetical protein
MVQSRDFGRADTVSPYHYNGATHVCGADIRAWWEAAAAIVALLVLMRIEFRLFLGIDAFSRILGMAFACSAKSSLSLAKQPLDSAAVAFEGCHMPRGRRRM